ncbi:MAG: Polypeptide-transport-associated domain protein FtsQ-type [Firmicutes bacterium]|nr:Polypeptide-transport-associated domain protein FtsQ-type [Bacillota bacterium]
MRTYERQERTSRPKRSIQTSRVIFLLIVLMILLAAFLFINSNFFQVGSVVIEDNKYMLADDVSRAAGVPERINIFRLDTAEIKSRLLRDLRISEVEVFRRFPTTIVIKVKERVESEQVKLVLEYLTALDEATLNELSEVNINSSGELTAYTVQSATIRLGAGGRLAEKAKMTGDILQDIGNRKAAVDYIDLNYASPYIKFRQ